jgi:hypothetical protein
MFQYVYLFVFTYLVLTHVRRPEKDHAKQIEALSLLFKTHPELIGADDKHSPSSQISHLESLEGLGQSGWLDIGPPGEPAQRKPVREGVSLVLLGSARHQDDLARVEELKQLAVKLGVEVSRTIPPSFSYLLVPHQ